MFEVQPVRKPHGGPDRLLAALVLLVVAGLSVALWKPWDTARAPQLALASPLAAPSPSSTPAPPGSYRNYSTRLFGEFPHPPAYELWPAGYVVTYGISRQLLYRPRPVPPMGIDAANALDLGPSGIVVALGINHPRDTLVRGIRLWRFPSGQPPVRVAIIGLPSPFDLSTFPVIGIPAQPGGDLLSPWQPGLYRLDLLSSASGDVARTPQVLSLTLRVDQNYGAPGESPEAAPAATASGSDVDSQALRQAAQPDSLLGFGPGGVELRRLGVGAPGQADCDLAETWAAELDGDPFCSPLPVHQVVGIAFAPGAGVVVRSVSLWRLDPQPGPVATKPVPAIPGVAAVVGASGQLLPEGTYRLDVRLRSGESRSWYLEVTPGGGAIPSGAASR